MSSAFTLFASVFLFGLFLAPAASSCDVDESIKLRGVHREVSLKQQFAHVRVNASASGFSGAVPVFCIPVPAPVHGAATQLRVLVDGEAILGTRISIVGSEPASLTWKVLLNGIGQSAALSWEYYIVSAMKALPKEIAQGEHQLMLYRDTTSIASPYAIADLTTKFVLPAKPESYSKGSSFEPVAAVSKPGGTFEITYGPYSSVAKNSAGTALKLHFQLDAAFATFQSFRRILEVSHWGNVAFEEHCDLVHTGALLKGGFSRVEYHDLRQPAPASFRGLEASIPRTASDIYYRDGIGNISSSSIVATSKHLKVTIETRYPMFGGWKANFYWGYNLPTSKVLRTKDSPSTAGTDTFFLTFPLVPSFKDTFAVSSVHEIWLPEGASDPAVSVGGVAVPAADLIIDRHRFNLDTVGRLRLTFSASNVVATDFPRSKDLPQVVVTYKFAKMNLLREPVMLAATFLALFMFSISYARYASLM